MSAILLYGGQTNEKLTLFVAPYLKEHLKRILTVNVKRGNFPKHAVHQLAKLVKFLNHATLPLHQLVTVQMAFPIAGKRIYLVQLTRPSGGTEWKADKVLDPVVMTDYYGMNRVAGSQVIDEWYKTTNYTSDGSIKLFVDWWTRNGQLVLSSLKEAPPQLIHIVCHNSVMRAFCGPKCDRNVTAKNIWSMVFNAGQSTPPEITHGTERLPASSSSIRNELCGWSGSVSVTDYKNAGLQ